MKLTIRSAPLPTNFLGTPQELFEAMLDRMEVVADDLTSFVVQDLEPGSNVGPWFKSGKKLYVWDNQTNPSGAYVPLDISDSLDDEIHVSPEDPLNLGKPLGIGDYETAVPPKVAPRIWMQTDSALQKVIGIWYNFGGTIGWKLGPATLTEGGVALSCLKPNADTAKHVLVVSDDGTYITSRPCKIARLPEPTEVDAGKVVLVNSTGDGYEHGVVLGRALQCIVAQFSSVAISGSPFTSGSVGTTGTLVASVEITMQANNSLLRARYVGQAGGNSNGFWGVSLAVAVGEDGSAVVPLRVTDPDENGYNGVGTVSIEAVKASPGAGKTLTVQLRAAVSSGAAGLSGTLEPSLFGVSNKGYFVVEEIVGTLT